MVENPWASADTADAASDFLYHKRASYVYHGPAKDRPKNICRAKGRWHAECMLDRGHEGDHYGSGYDEGGPRPAIRWDKK